MHLAEISPGSFRHRFPNRETDDEVGRTAALIIPAQLTGPLKELILGSTYEFVLIAASFLASTMTATLGIGGGVLLLSVMAIFLPPVAIVPVHGVVLLVMSATRGLFGFRHIQWRIPEQYLSGAIIGAALGSQFVTRVPPGLIPVLLGTFILIVTWMPPIRTEAQVPFKFLWLGGVKTFLSLFVGATGPLLTPFVLREGLSRDEFVVTVAVLATISHVLKVTTFGLLGFSYAPYMPLLAGMIIVVTFGSYLGTRLRGKAPEQLFRQAVKILVTVLASRMIIKVTLG